MVFLEKHIKVCKNQFETQITTSLPTLAETLSQTSKPKKEKNMQPHELETYDRESQMRG